MGGPSHREAAQVYSRLSPRTLQVVANNKLTCYNSRYKMEKGTGLPQIRCRSSPVPTTSGFIKWFNNSSPTGKHPFGPLTRAGIAHLYFVSIQPRGWQWPYWPSVIREGAGAKHRPANPDRPRLHHPAQAEGLLRGACFLPDAAIEQEAFADRRGQEFHLRLLSLEDFSRRWKREPGA